MQLEYNDICIRNATSEDCKQLAIWWNDGKVMAHAGFPLGLNIKAEEIEKQIALDDDATKRRLMIVNYNLGDNIAEIGIKICKTDYQEKGLGRVILSMLIRELFKQGYQKIKLDTNLENKRAQHVYEKLGFSKVAIRENCWKDQLGNLQSAVDYELTQDAFIAYL